MAGWMAAAPLVCLCPQEGAEHGMRSLLHVLRAQLLHSTLQLPLDWHPYLQFLYPPDTRSLHFASMAAGAAKAACIGDPGLLCRPFTAAWCSTATDVVFPFLPAFVINICLVWSTSGAGCAHHSPGSQEPSQGLGSVWDSKGHSSTGTAPVWIFCPVSLCWLMEGLSLKQGGTWPTLLQSSAHT